jgi:hypothetical protein
VPWVKLDDGFTDHPKMDGLSHGAFRLHVAGLCHAGRTLTDGFVSSSWAPRLMADFEPRYVDDLVAAGLWDVAPGGWAIHDYLAYNPSATEVKAEREKAAKRMRQRRSEERSGEQPAERSGERAPERSGEVQPLVRLPRPVPSPTPPDPNPTPTSFSGSSLGGGERVCGSQGATPETPPDFEAFWQAFPKRDGKRIGKADAVRVWGRLTRQQRAAARVAVNHYAEACSRPGSPSAMDPHRWLTRRRWEDWQTPATPPDHNGHRGPSTGDFLALAAQLREEGE